MSEAGEIIYSSSSVNSSYAETSRTITGLSASILIVYYRKEGALGGAAVEFLRESAWRECLVAFLIVFFGIVSIGALLIFVLMKPSTEEERRYEQTTCVICLEQLGETPEVTRLRCAHVFHSECISASDSAVPAICPFVRIVPRNAGLQQLHIRRLSVVPGLSLPYQRLLRQISHVLSKRKLTSRDGGT